MSNSFDGDVTLEPGAIALWQDRTTSPPTNLILIGYTAVDPNGIRAGAVGSLLAGPTGTWRNTNGGTAWASMGNLGNLGSAGAVTLIADAVTEQTAGLIPVAASAWNRIGATLRLMILLLVENTDGITGVQVRVYVGSVLVLDLTKTPPTVGKPFYLAATLRPSSTGAAATVSFAVQGLCDMSVADVGAGAIPPVTLDLTAATDVMVTVTFDNVAAGNQVTLHGMTVDLAA